MIQGVMGKEDSSKPDAALARKAVLGYACKTGEVVAVYREPNGLVSVNLSERDRIPEKGLGHPLWRTLCTFGAAETEDEAFRDAARNLSSRLGKCLEELAVSGEVGGNAAEGQWIEELA